MYESNELLNISTILEFKEVPEFLNISNQSLSYSLDNTNENVNSEIILKPKDDKFNIKKIFCIKMNIPELVDWRLNLLDINIDERYIVIGIEKKVGLIPIQFIKCNSKDKFGKIKFILESDDLINQIKLMKDDKNQCYILAVDNKGILHSKLIKYCFFKDLVTEYKYKTFNCKVDAPDNSLWSIDCFYPFIAVGGNNRCVLLNYIHDDHIQEEGGIKNNLLLIGNKHNIPCVSFSPDGRYIACSSIDSEVKIWDALTGKLIKKITNKTKQWGWSTKFVDSKLFRVINRQIINVDIDNNNSQTQNSLLRNFINNLIGEQNTEIILEQANPQFLKDNSIFSKEFLMSIDSEFKEEEKSGFNNKTNYYHLDKQSLQDHFLKYFIICCHQNCLFLNSFYFKKDETSLSQLCLGKINLIGNLFKFKYNNSQNLIYSTAMNMKYYYEYSRYEYIYISNALNVFILGNRQGDIQIYDLELLLDDDGKLKLNEDPLTIIDCNGRIVGFKVIEHNNECIDGYLEIYVLKLNKILECYKFRKSND